MSLRFILQRLIVSRLVSLGGAAMSMNNAMIVGLAACALPFGTAVAAPVARLMPGEIQAMFFKGKPFTAASPSGVKFKMTFTADGKAKRVPAGKGGARSEGEWKLDDKGYCPTWKGRARSCFTVITNG